MSVTRHAGAVAGLTYLLSPFEGRPMTSRRSTLTGFNRLHGPGFERPPRADIEDIRGRLGGGWEKLEMTVMQRCESKTYSWLNPLAIQKHNAIIKKAFIVLSIWRL